MKRKVLLIVLPYLIDEKEIKSSKTTKLRSFKAFPYGVLSLATCLKKHANILVDVKVFDCNGNPNFWVDLISLISIYKPDITGISMMFDNSYQYLKVVLDTIKFNSSSLILLGGAATSFAQEEILKDQPFIDAICYGEGELPLFDLATSKNYKKELEKPHWVTHKSIAENTLPIKHQLQELDSIIDIDYSLIDIKEYQTMEEAFSPHVKNEDNKKQFFMVTSRGCTFKCSFCMNSSNPDKVIRYASVDSIIRHVDFLVKHYGMNVLTFYDDQILYNIKRAKELFKSLIPYNLRIEMPNGISVAYIDEELVDIMWEAGVDTVYLAVESGSPYVIKKLIHKPINLYKVKDTVKLFRKYNYWVLGYFVTGMPGETDEHRQETIDFIKDVGFDWVSFSLASPVRGSKLYQQCIESGYIEKKKLSIGFFEMPKYIIKTPEYSPDYITKKNYLMNLEVNFIHNYRMKIKDYNTAYDVFSFVVNKYPNHAIGWYCLLLVLQAIGGVRGYLSLCKKKIISILNSDLTWKEIFLHFNIKEGKL